MRMPARNHMKSAVLQTWCDDWNNKHPVGTEVVVARDNGDETRTKTRSEAWVLSGHSAVIQLEGISGCYSLERVRKAI